MKLGKRISFLSSYLGLKTLKALFIILPWNAAIKLGMFGCAIAAKVMDKRFRKNMQSIALAFPEKSEQEVYDICYASWQNMGRLAAEFVKCAAMRKENLLKKVVFKNIHYLKEQEAKGKAAIIHTGHFSNWEIFGIGVSALGVKKSVIAAGVKNPYIDKEIERMRCMYDGQVINSDDPFFKAVKTLKKGIHLGILSDQSSYKSAVFRKFFGRYCACSPLTPLLSLKLQIVVIPTKLYREDGKFVIEFLEPIVPAPTYSQQEVENFIDVLNKYYEDWIKEDPSDWLWAHNRWKREHDAPEYKAEQEAKHG
ncbi:KDO2-lipid IV(A) lauroyltransferase [Elusimicrobium simillimum]|uniref:lysophospholipid acyltransferase family protein n=1 Tax=Elusimicrobium simillimum TaxID=3143438 RepID=UPI003C6F78DF